MKNKLSGLHNILWAIGILAAGLALLVGLVVSMSARYEEAPGNVQQKVIEEAKALAEQE